jgi:ParB family chromosome partitioning protein
VAATKRKPARKKSAPSSRGLAPGEIAAEPPQQLREFTDLIASDGGVALATYRDPLAGRWLVLAALPVDKVEPTPFQRQNSPAHLKRLTDVIDAVGLYLDPIIATREADGRYRTPNGSHRLSALKKLGAKSVTALVVPEREIAFRILALNVEKSHNLKEKSLETIGMARALAADAEHSGREEASLALEFEEPVFLTLGTCYEKNGRFSGGAYRPALRRVEAFLHEPLPKALAARERRGALLEKVDERVGVIVQSLRERGIESPYLRSFVSARINPIRFAKTVTMSPEELLEKMQKSADKFDVGKIKAEDVKASGGYAEDEAE